MIPVFQHKPERRKHLVTRFITIISYSLIWNQSINHRMDDVRPFIGHCSKDSDVATECNRHKMTQKGPVLFAIVRTWTLQRKWMKKIPGSAISDRFTWASKHRSVWTLRGHRGTWPGLWKFLRIVVSYSTHTAPAFGHFRTLPMCLLAWKSDLAVTCCNYRLRDATHLNSWLLTKFKTSIFVPVWQVCQRHVKK